MFLSSRQNQRFQIELAQFKAFHMGTNESELFILLSTHLSVYNGKRLFIGCFHAFGTETGNIRDFLCRVL